MELDQPTALDLTVQAWGYVSANDFAREQAKNILPQKKHIISQKLIFLSKNMVSISLPFVSNLTP